jgi:phage replication initiation protein
MPSCDFINFDGVTMSTYNGKPRLSLSHQGKSRTFDESDASPFDAQRQCGRVGSSSSGSPREVIRGESPSALSVCIDFLSFTLRGADPVEVVAEARQFLGVQSEDRGRGWQGYENSIDLGGVGLVAFGGNQGTVLVSITGQGCGRIARFQLVREWAERLNARITRLDIAVDDHAGGIVTVPDAMRGWRDGEFAQGGRPPKARFVDDLGSNNGCTFYVGSRESGKLCRVYEKGKQLGDKESRWVRAEVEWRGKDRVIPWDAVSNPMPYIAGAYPFFAGFALVAERIRTVKRATQIVIEAAIVWARAACGPTLNVLLRHFEGDYASMVEAIRRDGAPRRLREWLRAGERLASFAEAGA